MPGLVRSTLLSLMMLLALSASAAEKKRVDKAKEAEAHKVYDEATALYNLGQFTEAAERYKAAYTLLPNPAMLYNIAQSYRQANDFKNALFFYRSFLRAMPSAPTRAQVEDRIAKLEEEMKHSHQLQTEPPTEVNPPPEATAQPQPTPAPVMAPPPPTAPTVQTQVTAQPAPPPTPVYKKWWLWTVVGVVVVGVGVGVGVGLGTAKSGPSTQLGTVSF